MLIPVSQGLGGSRETTPRKEVTREAADEALRERLARREISEEQLVETLRVLREYR